MVQNNPSSFDNAHDFHTEIYLGYQHLKMGLLEVTGCWVK